MIYDIYDIYCIIAMFYRRNRYSPYVLNCVRNFYLGLLSVQVYIEHWSVVSCFG